MELIPNPELSIVIPICNEEANIPELLERLISSAEIVTTSYELIFINDGSKDNSLELIKIFARENNAVKYISFSRNFGHQNAIISGIGHAEGNAIVIIDGDLQDPPELIPELYNKLRQGFQVVYAKRINR